jgi:hypothetical protein
MSVYEIRHYIPVAGKEKALADRFRNHTFQLLDKLGYKVAAAWEDAGGKGELWYLMEWGSHEEMRAAWESFKTNPDWLKIKELTERDGPLVSRIEATPVVASSQFADYRRGSQPSPGSKTDSVGNSRNVKD